MGFLKVRVANVVLQWIKRDFHLLDPALITKIDRFCEKTLQKDKLVEISKLIQNELADEVSSSQMNTCY